MSDPEDVLYRKVGKKYEPIGMFYHDYLSDGIWYVKGKGHSLSLLARFDEIGDLPGELSIVAKMHGHKAAYDCHEHFKNKPWNLYDVSEFLAKWFAGKAKK